MLSHVNSKKLIILTDTTFGLNNVLVKVETNIGIGYANGFHSEKSREARTVGSIGHMLYLQHTYPRITKITLNPYSYKTFV